MFHAKARRREEVQRLKLIVIPAKAGIQSYDPLDPGLRRGDGKGATFASSRLRVKQAELPRARQRRKIISAPSAAPIGRGRPQLLRIVILLTQPLNEVRHDAFRGRGAGFAR